ncbi:myosin-9-like isoform X2 [Colias croceus]|uniref:myosin-9-like isoform X2 n=1 Tax=Colias crocea TaxID=72248 RepID=UPI001E27F9E6|nr:myosin-9-like isoform X2 [Colias croceus]
MSTSVKSIKDKPHAASRIMPRQTVASAARAARNATNRNLALPNSQRLSPARAPPSPAASKIKTDIQRSGKSETKTEIQVNKAREPEAVAESDIFFLHNKEPVSEVVEGQIEEVALQDNIKEITTEDVQNNLDRSDIDILRSIDENYNSSITLDPEKLLLTSESEEISRPQTPVPSLPQTPYTVSSRPQTPRLPSRPTTPAPSAQRNNTPYSRPNTPQKATPMRPKTPSKLAPARPTTPIAYSLSKLPAKEDDIKATYAAKQKQFHRMKKELDLKQQALLELFDILRSLRERMINEGISAGGEGVSKLVLFNVADWTADEITQLCRSAANPSITDGAVELFNTSVSIDEETLADVESKAVNIPACFADLCLKAFTARQELIDWMKEYLEKEQEVDNNALDRIALYNNQGLQMCEALRDLKSRADEAVNTITVLSKRACRERATLLSVGESLVREVARLRQDLEERTASRSDETRNDTETAKILEETRKELEDERAAKGLIKEKLATTESQLRQTRLRVSKMDRQLREAEASIASLTGTVKSLEDQSRQREVQLEARARKLKESLKTGEVASNHLAQQRDALQAEVADLTEQIKNMTSQHKSAIQDLNNKLKDINLTLEAERESSQREAELNSELRNSLAESQNTIEELKAKITELENSRPNPDFPTEREMDLWAELQATKDTLRIAEEEVTASKKEKVRFLETFTKMNEPENKMGLQQKLAAELLGKEEIISKMQTQLRDLTKNIKLNEQKVIQYEQYVRDLQAHNRAIANCQETPNGISYQDLQQEIMSLKMGLLDAVHRNEELSEMLAQKEQQLEQQDKTSRAQARVIKIREELINMLKNKETEQSRELAALQQDLEHRMKIVDDVNKQIAAKADEIQELFSTLETKQQQIHRLEKIVLALEEQQRRAQAQRTRHEEKIAALEHELAAGGNRKDKRFVFF